MGPAASPSVSMELVNSLAASSTSFTSVELRPVTGWPYLQRVEQGHATGNQSQGHQGPLPP